MKINFSKATKPQCEVIVCLVGANLTFGSNLAQLDTNGAIKKAALASPVFTGDDKQCMTIYAPSIAGVDVLVLVGIGELDKCNELSMQKVGAKVADQLNALKVKKASIMLDTFGNIKINEADIAANMALGLRLKNYIFDKYFVDKKEKNKLYLEIIDLQLNEPKAAEKKLAAIDCIAEGVVLTRNLVAEPPNVIYPKSFMEECKKLKKLGVKITVLDQKMMKKLGMHTLLGVAQGSAKEPYTVIMEWNGVGKSKEKPIAIVGKGVCFDSGGINLKSTASGIADMKYDMAGAATVVGLMHTLARRKAKAHVIGAVGLVENMPSGTAQRPSDVVCSMSGQTIEVENTDAEGRLVLADVLWYTQTSYNPRIIVDLATLTGAVVIALGEGHAGLFANDDTLAQQLYTAGEETGEAVWRLPMGEYYDQQINSEIADVRNSGTGRGGGAITAAQFLQRFIQKDKIWAHIDIAGMAWAKNGTPLAPKGATGFGVRLLDAWIAKVFG
ncbi:MAG: leucyl aminopeptidase [Proteobacteria bacterium]|nr:leucyl aminopeptidase [Pseudomonadota bacterium]